MEQFVPTQILIFLIGFTYPQHAVILHQSCKHVADFNTRLANMSDTGTAIEKMAGKNKRQCLLECLSNRECMSVNFKRDGGNCELLSRNLTNSVETLSHNVGWEYITTNQYERNVGNKCKMLSPCENGGQCYDTCSERGFSCICPEKYTGDFCQDLKVFSSCKDVYHAGFRTDGPYMLANIGYHYCLLNSTTLCGNGGYTLALKADGRKDTFSFPKNYWTTNNVYNHVFALKSGMDGDEEAKFPAFNVLPISRICLVMRDGTNFKSIVFVKKSTSLLQLISSGSYITTGKDKPIWLDLLPGVHFQNNCNKQGFNIVIESSDTNLKVRLGILGNNEENCLSPDTAIGIGFGGGSATVYTGAIGSNKAAFGFLLIK